MSFSAVLAAEEAEETNNFLIPNFTFFLEVLVFLVILWFLAKKVVPRINALLEQRQQTIKNQFDEAEKARDEAEKAKKEYTDALAETRRDISRRREEANA
jgi:F-type H+-transporting ATPase subunit b